MALTEETVLTKFEVNPDTKTVNCRMDTVIKKDGEEISRTSHRKAFMQGQIEDVKTYINKTTGPEIDYLNTLWV
jgi:hypothetical protein